MRRWRKLRDNFVPAMKEMWDKYSIIKHEANGAARVYLLNIKKKKKSKSSTEYTVALSAEEAF